MSGKRPYASPHLYRHDADAEHPFWIRESVNSIRMELGLVTPLQRGEAAQLVAVVDTERRYVEVSDSFCQLMGYQREELIGKQYDELTAPDSNDIASIYALFARLGYMQGLWMLVTRQGTRVLVRYESWLRPDAYIEGHMELFGAGY
jgi:PAS domain S-box-containing protein